MVSCTEHDYVEIACLYKLPVILTLRSGEKLEGVAIDTQRNQDRAECLKIKTGNDEQLVVLDHILHMEATELNPHFRKVAFDKQP